MKLLTQANFVVLNDIASPNEKTTLRWFWCFLVARGGIDLDL